MAKGELKMNQPYIGITGFMSRKEVDEILQNVPADLNRQIMIGVLASFKTLQHFKNSMPNRYPELENIRGIFSQHPKALNLIHYNTKERETLCAQLLGLAKIAGHHLHGFQLNVSWPEPKDLETFHTQSDKKMKIVLQIGSGAFEKIDHSPEKLARKVKTEYEGLIDYILLDPSGGQGKQFDPEKAKAYLDALLDVNINAALGVAGGLCAETLGSFELLVKYFPDLCVDAEGRLRDKDDNLDLKLAQAYLRRAINIFSQA